MLSICLAVIPCAMQHANAASQARDLLQAIPDQRSNIACCSASGMTEEGAQCR